MRLLNMNDLGYLRRTKLKGHQCIGKGSFCSVFAEHENSSKVTKVTTDRLSYYMLTDGFWASVRESVGIAFPEVIEDHGGVGVSRGLDVYMVDVERLMPIATTENRRAVRRISKEYEVFLRKYPNKYRRMSDRLNFASIDFCQKKSEQEDEPYQEVFDALLDFVSNFGGALDLTPSNFMQRADGSLVWNDVVFDAKTYLQ
ncbi:hypothetical protein [Novimethylophilus kurashikiensis]|nr:hypothetical protein [Novimethylophilus kurashikiensis]